MPERTVSRVLSRTIIHLGQLSPTASSNLPGSPLGTGGAATGRVLPYLVLLRAGFTVPRTVTSRAVRSYRTFSPLPAKSRRSVFCGTFHGLTPPRRYLAPCPKEPGLSSVTQTATAIAWPTPTFPAAILQQNAFCRSVACSATSYERAPARDRGAAVGAALARRPVAAPHGRPLRGSQK